MHALRALPHSRARTQSFEKRTEKRRYRAEKECAWVQNIGENNVVPLAQLYLLPLKCRGVVRKCAMGSQGLSLWTIFAILKLKIWGHGSFGEIKENGSRGEEGGKIGNRR